VTPTSETLDTTFTRWVHTRYLLYLPPDYATSQDSFPLVLFLHGAGERGDDLEKVTVHGPPKLARERSFPFILAAPQVSEGDIWSTDDLIALLDHLVSTLRVDPDRIYVTGLSMGGFAAWDLAVAEPDRFAAVVPISGGALPTGVCRLKGLAVWIVHGADDDVIPVDWAEEDARRMESCGLHPKLTIYPGVGHDAWTQTYADPEFWTWLLAQRRLSPP
jgi:predicted peptidase